MILQNHIWGAAVFMAVKGDPYSDGLIRFVAKRYLKMATIIDPAR